jgi:hypothetical protein
VSSSLVLTLDTAGPEVTWGTPTGTAPGETLRIPYTADEPLARAVLHLGSGDLNLVVESGALSVALPFDATTGPAAVSVYDDVGNEIRTPAVVTIEVGAPPPPPPALGGGIILPRRRKPSLREPRRKQRVRKPSRRVLYDRSRASATESTTIWVKVVESGVVATVRTSDTVRVHVSETQFATANTGPDYVMVRLPLEVTPVTASDDWTWRDGPSVEALILLMD